MSTVEGFFADANLQQQQRIDRNARARMSDRHLNSLAELAASYDQIAFSNASNLAMREALTRQLARFDPKNPLVIDQKLRDKIMDAGEAAYVSAFKAGRLNELWEGAKAIGRGYPIPGRPYPHLLRHPRPLHIATMRSHRLHWMRGTPQTTSFARGVSISACGL